MKSDSLKRKDRTVVGFLRPLQINTHAGPDKQMMDILESDSSGMHAVQGEGSWIYSYADLITLLLMFFLIMLSISKVSEEQFESVRESIKTEMLVKPEGKVNKNQKVIINKVKPNALQSDLTDGAIREQLSQSASKDRVSQKQEIEKTIEKPLTLSNKIELPNEQILAVKEVLARKGVLAKGVDFSVSGKEVTLVFPSQSIFKKYQVGVKKESAELVNSVFNAFGKISQGWELEIEVHSSAKGTLAPWSTTSARAATLANMANGILGPNIKISAVGKGSSAPLSKSTLENLSQKNPRKDIGSFNRRIILRAVLRDAKLGEGK